MSKTALNPEIDTKEAAIVTRAVTRASDNLKIPNRILASIIGLSEPTISRMKKGTYFLNRAEKAFELSVLFVRMYRSLTAIVGGDDAIAQSWLNNYNTALHANPLERIQSVNGLMDVINYLDARRAII
jgi:hypothetical protein